ALLPADRLHRLRATAAAAGCGRVHTPRLPRLLPGGALMGQVPRRRPAARTSPGATQGVDVRRFRHHARVGACRTPLSGRWPRRVELGGGHRRTMGALVLPLATVADDVCWHRAERGRLARELELSMKKAVPVESASARIDERLQKLGDWRAK